MSVFCFPLQAADVAVDKDHSPQPLVIAMDQGFYPVTFVDGTGEPAGLFVDIWRLWARHTGRDIVFRPGLWNDTLTALRDGDADIHSGLFQSEERAAWLDFSLPFYGIGSALFYSSLQEPVTGLAALAGQPVGAEKGAFQAEYLRRHSAARVVEFDTGEAMIRAAVAGDIRAFLAEAPTTQIMLDRLELSGGIESTGELLFSKAFHAGVLKGNAQLLLEVNQGLAALPDDALAALERRWVSYPGFRYFVADRSSLLQQLTDRERAWLAQHPVIRVGGEADWAPFDFIGDDGNYQGLTADYLALLSQRLGMTFEVVAEQPWSATLEMLKNKQLDAIGAIARNPRREAFALFTRPYTTFSSMVFTQRDHAPIAGLEDLTGQTVAVERGYFAHDKLRVDYPQIKLLEVDTTLQALEAVSQGRAQGYVGTLAVADYLLEKYFISNLKVAAKTPFATTGLSIGVRDDWPELRSILDKGLSAITAAEHIEIRRRWGALEAQTGTGRHDVVLTTEEIAWLREHPHLRLTGDPNWLPFEAFTDKGDYIGIIPEIIASLERRSGVVFERLPSGTWLNALRMVRDGEADVISADLAVEEVRSTHTFSQPYLELPLAIVMRTEQTDIVPDLYDIADRRIAVIAGYGYTWELAQQYPDIHFIEVENVQTALSGLAAGRYDALVATFTASSYHINQMGLLNLRIVGRLPIVMKVGLAVRKDWPQLLGILNKAIVAMTPAEKQRIIELWMQDKYVERIDYDLVWQVAVAAGVIIATILLWNYFVRRQREQLRISEERFQLAMAAASDGIWDWNIASGEVYYSPGYLKMLGYQPGELAEREETWEALLHPDDKAAALSMVETAIHQALPHYEHEFRLRGKDGIYRNILSRGGVVRTDAKGRALRSVGTQTDVSERKQAEDALRKLSRTVEQSPAMVMITDCRGVIEYVNPKFTQVTGYSLEEAVGQTPGLLKSGLTPADVYADLWQTIRAGREWHGELQNRKKNGEVYWERESISPLMGEDGTIRYYVALKEDITAQKATEEHLEVFRRFAETSGQGFGMATLDGEITYVNRTLCRMLEEASPDDVRRKQVDHYYPADIQQRLQQEIIPALKEHGQWTGELTLCSATGKCIPTLENFFVIRDERGKARYFGDVITDITAQKNAEQTLHFAKNQAEQASRFKSEFLANMSHEIRTPLNAIMGMTHLATKTGLNPRQQDYLSKIQSSSQTLLGVINDILDFSKIEAGRLAIERTEFYLENVFENLSNVESLRAAEKGIEIIYAIDNAVPSALVGDPLRLGQVLINLTNNAVKFTEQGQILITVSLVRSDAQCDVLRFSVEDTGIGIDQEKIGRLFEPFTQVDGSTTRKYGGTGLGLAICKQLVTMMGGEIGVQSVPSRGSTFFFTAEFGRPRAVAETPRLSAPDLRGTRVLVVDDNAIVRQTLREMLASFSFDVSTAVSGAAALAELESAAADEGRALPYDVVLMDWKMPGMDGIETSRLIRHAGWLPRIPTIIMVTAYGREEVMHAAREVGVDAFLVKPVSPSSLFDTLMAALGRGGGGAGAAAMSGHETVVPDFRGAKVLLVEDNRLNQQVALEMLESTGLEVVVADNGAKAVQAVQASDFALVLMDIQMPDLDGYQATRMIRKDDRYATLPIVAMTAHAMAGDRERCLEAGMNDHLPKPIDPDGLYAMLTRWLAQEGALVAEPLVDQDGGQDGDPLPDSLPGLDLHKGLARLGGNRKLLSKLLLEFVDDHGNDDDALGRALNARDTALARRLVHTLRGVAGSIGAERLEEKAQVLEQAIAKDRPYMESLIPFAGEFRLVMDGLARARAGLAGDPSVSDSAVVDQVQWREGLRALDTLLLEGDPRAVAHLAKIKTQFEARDLSDVLQTLGAQIADYDFDDARDTLSQIIGRHDSTHSLQGTEA